MDRLARTGIVSLATAAVLATIAFVQLRFGPDSSPAPLLDLLQWLFGYEPALAARLLIGLEFALAAAVFGCSRRVANDLALGLVAFVALSCLSRAFRDGGFVAPVLALAVAIGLLVASSKAAARERTASTPSRRGLSPGWSLLGAIGIFTVAANLTASLAFRERSAEAGSAASAPSDAPKQTTASIDLDMRPYIGKRLVDTPLAGYLPELAGMVGETTAFLVFYNPQCETCHTVFREHFNLPRPEIVVAVEIPQGDGAIAAAGDGLGDIECLSCERLSLPQGPNWLIAPPMTVRIEGGKIVCVADRFGGDCFTP